MTYLIVQIDNKKLGVLADFSYSPEEIITHMKTFIELDTIIVNAIAKEIGTNDEKCYQTITTTTPYLFKGTKE